MSSQKIIGSTAVGLNLCLEMLFWYITGLMITFILGLTKCLIILSFDQTSFRFEQTYILPY